MNSLRSMAAPGYVLRGDQGSRMRPARMSADLTTTPFTAVGVADPRLVDPHLEAVVEEAKSQAREAGYVSGHQAGLQVGRQEGLELLAAQQQVLVEQDAQERAARKERLVELLGALESAVAAALDYQAPRVEEMRDLIAEMAVDIAEVLVGHHLQVEDCAAKDAVVRALSRVPREASVTLRLHPADVALIAEYVDEVTDWQVARVVPDPAIERGDAAAHAQNLEVEASISGGLARMREVLNP
ncbi:MAG: FliH/SctL family protein [Micrococcales bacterium]|nr:FliH/SctL family protein [Micrococcales bacterium]